jgi:hypothetical protein
MLAHHSKQEPHLVTFHQIHSIANHTTNCDNNHRSAPTTFTHRFQLVLGSAATINQFNYKVYRDQVNLFISHNWIHNSNSAFTTSNNSSYPNLINPNLSNQTPPPSSSVFAPATHILTPAVNTFEESTVGIFLSISDRVFGK